MINFLEHKFDEHYELENILTPQITNYVPLFLIKYLVTIIVDNSVRFKQ